MARGDRGVGPCTATATNLPDFWRRPRAHLSLIEAQKKKMGPASSARTCHNTHWNLVRLVRSRKRRFLATTRPRCRRDRVVVEVGKEDAETRLHQPLDTSHIRAPKTRCLEVAVERGLIEVRLLATIKVRRRCKRSRAAATHLIWILSRVTWRRSARDCGPFFSLSREGMSLAPQRHKNLTPATITINTHP